MSNNPFENLINVNEIRKLSRENLGPLTANGRVDPCSIIQKFFLEKLAEKGIKDIEVSVGWLQQDMSMALAEGWVPIQSRLFLEEWNKSAATSLQLNDCNGALAYKGKAICLRPIEVGKERQALRDAETQRMYDAMFGRGTKRTVTPVEVGGSYVEESAQTTTQEVVRKPGRPPKIKE